MGTLGHSPSVISVQLQFTGLYLQEFLQLMYTQTGKCVAKDPKAVTHTGSHCILLSLLLYSNLKHKVTAFL